MQRIVVIDYGMGNLRSVAKAVETVAPEDEVLVSANLAVIESADRIVCPGQGAAADCMHALQSGQLDKTIRNMIGTKPFLGICMGMQVLLSHSDENDGVDCINVFDGNVRRFANPLVDKDGTRLKVPHMGWSEVTQTQPHTLWLGIAQNARFYFAHSYYCAPESEEVVVGSCQYGSAFAVAIAAENTFACQFHPEKSARDGLALLKNFVTWNGAA